MSATIRIGRVEHRVSVLGPGVRSVAWVAGCTLACPGCITPELWDRASGRETLVVAVADELAQHAVDGITWSGGEPFEQAAAVLAVTRAVLERRPELSVMSYSGFRLEALRRRRDPATDALLAMFDLLVDGRYVARRHAGLRWRGSDNQRIHDLSGRHRTELRAPDEPAGMHQHLDPDGHLRFTGVPPAPDFRAQLARALRQPHHLDAPSTPQPEQETAP